jgi:hypothetical protein
MARGVSREGRTPTGAPNLQAGGKLVLRPLPVAIRLDISLGAGPSGPIPATRLYWIAMGGGQAPERVLSTLVLTS